MEKFNYEAYARHGQKVTGVELAETVQEVEAVLRSRGLMPRQVSKRNRLQLSLQRSQKVSDLDFLVFVGEFVVLLESGMGIPEALNILCDDEEQSPLAFHLTNVLERVQAGMSLSQACQQSPSVFRTFFISALKTAEQSGDMLRPLQAYSQQLERTVELKRKVSQALAYPLFLLVTFAIILTLMFVFVVPNFTSMYDDLATEMPALTVWLLNTVEQLPLILSMLAVILIVATAVTKYLRRQPQGEVHLDRLRTKLPLFGHIYSLLTFWQFTQSLASLLRGGASLLFAMKTAREGVDNHHFSEQLITTIERIQQGESLSKALREETDYPRKSLKMIAVGEESGALESMLESIARHYERLLDDQVKRISSLVEPVIMLLIGVVVGVVIVALYLPVFGMVNVIG